MHDPVAVVASVPALRRGWASSLRTLRFRAEERDDLSSWVQIEGGRAALLITESLNDLQVATNLRYHSEDLAVIVLLPHASEEDQLAALGLGAVGVGDWSASVEEVAVMIQAGLLGRSTIPVRMGPRLAESLDNHAITSLDLSDRALLKNLVHGATIHEVAEQLGYSERDTFRRLRALYHKIGVNTRTEAVVQATRWGFFD